jgi:hypothetical protein
MVISTLPATLEKGTNYQSSLSPIREGNFIQFKGGICLSH